MKSTIDNRIAEVLKLLDEKDKNDLFKEHSVDREKIRSAIEYLKDYAKIQTVSKMLSNQDSVKKDVEETKNKILAIIEQKKAEILNMPKVDKRKKKINGIYAFEEDLKNSEEERIKRESDERKAKIQQIREEIKSYRDKIKRLNSISRSLSSPNKTAQKLFPEEQMRIKENYNRLVNMCVATIANDELSKSELIGDDKVFKFDGKNYSINYNNARKFISMLKSKKEIISSAEYINKKEKYEETIVALEEENTKQEVFKEAYEISDSDEFKKIADKMNEISKKFSELKANEIKAQDGNILTRAKNGIRTMIGMDKRVRVPKKVVEQRMNLANTISNFMSDIKSDDKLKDTYDKFFAIRKNVGDGYKLNIEMLENVPFKLRTYGGLTINCIPEGLAKPGELRVFAKKFENASMQKKEQLEKQKETLENEKAEIYSKLNKKAQKMVNLEDNKQSILRCAQRYYGVGNWAKKANQNETNLSASAAVIILEGILGKRKIPMENIFKYYAEIIGKDNLAKDTIDINKTIYSKIDLIKDQMNEMLQQSNKEENENERYS